jgi:hypothetical protein
VVLCSFLTVALFAKAAGQTHEARACRATVIMQSRKTDIAHNCRDLRAQPMPTIADLLSCGAIVKIEVDLAARDQPLRLLYGTPQFIAWLRDVLDGLEPPCRLGDASIAEQIDDLFYSFLSGEQLIFTKQFRVVRAEDNAVWELKTPDVRIFGWFMAKDCFVAAFGNWADTIKDHDLYRGYRIAIRRLRRELGIDATLCVKGVAPDDVLSV